MPQYEIEPYTSYSGSYTDNVITGNLLPTGNSWSRACVGSNAQDDPRYYAGVLNYGEYYRLYNNNTALGKSQRTVSFKSQNRIYDSLPPDLERIWAVDGAKICLTNYNNPSRTIMRIAFIVGMFEEGTEYKLTSSADSTNVISNQKWVYSYPFQLKYANITRRKDDIADSTAIKIYASSSFARIGSAYNVAGTSTTGKTMDDIVYSGTDAFFGGQNTFNKNTSLIVGFYRKKSAGVESGATHTYFPCEEITSTTTSPPVPASPIAVSENIRPALITDTIKMIYGFGDGPSHMPEWSTDVLQFAIADQPIRFGFGSQIRGWKYGLYSGLPMYEKMSVNRNHYGFIRDVLEQRPYTKILKPDGTIESPIQVVFISGSSDYVTASNPTLNTRSSGLYDVFYASGAPWAE